MSEEENNNVIVEDDTASTSDTASVTIAVSGDLPQHCINLIFVPLNLAAFVLQETEVNNIKTMIIAKIILKSFIFTSLIF